MSSSDRQGEPIDMELLSLLSLPVSTPESLSAISSVQTDFINFCISTQLRIIYKNPIQNSNETNNNNRLATPLQIQLYLKMLSPPQRGWEKR